MCNCSFKVILIKSCGDLFLWNRNWGFGRVEFRLHIFFLFHGVHTLSFTLPHHRGGICRSPGAGGPLCLGWLPGFMGIWCKRLNTITTIWSTPFILPQAIEASDVWMVRRCCLTDKPLVAGRYHLTLLGLRPVPFPITMAPRLGVVHKLCWHHFGCFWPPTPLRWHFLRYEPRHDLRCAIASCELRCAIASCDVRVRTHFGCKLRCACVRCF